MEELARSQPMEVKTVDNMRLSLRAIEVYERLSKLVYLMYLWSGETTVKSAADTTGVSQKTIVQLYQYM
jgi:hypothetical protein